MDVHCEKMCRPGDQNVGERSEAPPAGRQIEREIKPVAALPIGKAVVFVEGCNFQAARQSQEGYQRRNRLATELVEGFLISAKQHAILHHQFLGPEKQLRRPQEENVLTLIQDVAQDDLYQLIDEKRGKSPGMCHEIQVGGLQREM